MALGAYMYPYSYMYCAPHRNGVLQTNLDYGFYEIWHGFLGLYDDYLISKSRVFIEWYPKLRFLEIKVG